MARAVWFCLASSPTSRPLSFQTGGIGPCLATWAKYLYLTFVVVAVQVAAYLQQNHVNGFTSVRQPSASVLLAPLAEPWDHEIERFSNNTASDGLRVWPQSG